MALMEELKELANNGESGLEADLEALRWKSFTLTELYGSYA